MIFVTEHPVALRSLAALGGIACRALLLGFGQPSMALPRASPWSCSAAARLAELLERYLFFRAAPASRMPGGLR